MIFSIRRIGRAVPKVNNSHMSIVKYLARPSIRKAQHYQTIDYFALKI